MLEFLERVARYLEELTEANRRLLDALGGYQKLLIAGESLAIEKATPALDRHAGRIRRLDEERRAFVDDFFIQRNWNGPRNFSAISEHVSEAGVTDEEAAAFEKAAAARMKLIGTLAEVDAQNSLNLILIGQGMSFAEAGLRALLGLDRDPSTYGPGMPTEDGPTLLDAQA
jgi:hypothetical protein